MANMPNPPIKHSRQPRLHGAGPALCFLVSSLFFWVWYERYVKIEFNELGRYYDETNQVVYTDSAFVWIVPATLFLIAGLFGLLRACQRGRAHRGNDVKAQG